MVGQKFKLMSFSNGIKEETGRAWNRVEVRCYDVESCYATSIVEFIDSTLAQKLENLGMTKPGFDGIDISVTVGFDSRFRKVITNIEPIKTVMPFDEEVDFN